MLSGTGLQTHTSLDNSLLTYTMLVSAGFRTALVRSVRCFKYNVCIMVFLVEYFLSNDFGLKMLSFFKKKKKQKKQNVHKHILSAFHDLSVGIIQTP